MENVNEKTSERILKVNKKTISIILYLLIIIAATRIIFYTNFYDSVVSLIPISFVLYFSITSLKNITKSKTLEEFDYNFLIFLFPYYFQYFLVPLLNLFSEKKLI